MASSIGTISQNRDSRGKLPGIPPFPSQNPKSHLKKHPPTREIHSCTSKLVRLFLPSLKSNLQNVIPALRNGLIFASGMQIRGLEKLTQSYLVSHTKFAKLKNQCICNQMLILNDFAVQWHVALVLEPPTIMSAFIFLQFISQKNLS